MISEPMKLGIAIGIAGFIFSVLMNSFLIPTIPIDLSIHSLGNGITGFIIGFTGVYFALIMFLKKSAEL